MPPIVVTASTSVVLVNSSNQPIPTVYFPAISTLGRLVTVRDSDGFVSTGNYIYLQGCNGVTFGDGLSTLSITQPYGFLTLNATSQNNYSIVNTFAFPLGSTAAYVSNVTASTMYITNTIYSRDLVTFSTNTITSSNEELCFNGIPTGTVTPAQLTSTTIAVEAYASNLLFINVRRLVAIGVTSSNLAGCNNPVGTIIYSDNNTPFDLSDGGTGGFSNGGTDVYYGAGLWIAAGDNRGSTPTGCNTGFLQWSLDGKYWVNSVSPNLNANRLRNRVYWANNRYHAVGYNNALGTSGGPFTILHSGNGKSWLPSIGSPFQGPSANLNYATGIAFGRGVWVASGLQEANVTGSSLLWSPDGSNWNQANSTDWFNTPDAKAYDVAYNAGNFIALINNDTPTTNLAISTDGSNWATAGITNGGLNNEPGYLGYSPDQWIVVTQNYHKFSVDDGYTWNTIQDFPTGYPFRPYYDGATWWVSVSTNTTAQSIYYSFTGSNQWSNWLTGGGFENGGYAKSFYSIFAQSNLNLQLLSSMQGISINFATSNLSACNINANNISANAITLGTDAIITSNEVLVATVKTSDVGESLWYSVDNGQTYQASVSGGFDNGAFSAAYNGTGLWVAVGSSCNSQTSSIQYSTDASNWNIATSGGFNSGTIYQGNRVAYANNVWIAVGCNTDERKRILRSFNGQSWDYIGENAKFGCNLGAGFGVSPGTNQFGQNLWVAVGSGSSEFSTIMYSIDNGASWLYTNNGFVSGRGRAVTYAPPSVFSPNGRWVAVGRPSALPGCNGILYSSDGINWSSNNAIRSYVELFDVAYSQQEGTFVAVGQFASGPGNTTSTIIYSTDGINWNSAKTGGFRVSVGADAGQGVTYGTNGWFASGRSNNNVGLILTSTDSSNWTTIPGAPLVGQSTITSVNTGITVTTQQIGKVFISAGTILANTINLNNGLLSNVCSMRFTKIDIAGTQNTSVSIGTRAGLNNQAQDTVALGTEAGFETQNNFAVAIGPYAGQSNQGVNTVAIGFKAGNDTQFGGSIAIGSEAGLRQFDNAVAIGVQAGYSNQRTAGVAIGVQAGFFEQQQNSVAIGTASGFDTQGQGSTAVGSESGRYFQSPSATALGGLAGYSNQGFGSVAVGVASGALNQGLYSVAIGYNAGLHNQASNSIIITAGGCNSENFGTNSIYLNASSSSSNNNSIANAFVVRPVRSNVTNFTMFYDTTTGEIGYGSNTGVATTANFASNLFSSSGYTAGSLSTNTISTARLVAGGISTNTISTGSIFVDYISVNSLTVFGPSTLTVLGTTFLSSATIGTLSTNILYVNTLSTNSIQASLSSNVTSNIAYYNTTTNQLSYGAQVAAGQNFATSNDIAIGCNAKALATYNQVNIGVDAGSNSQGTYSVAVGYQAGKEATGTQFVAIGYQAGSNTAGTTVSIGNAAGCFNQQDNTVAIGDNAGLQDQQYYATAVGYYAGQTNQQTNAVAIGAQAGNSGQKEYSVAIGAGAGQISQQSNAVAVGYQAGFTGQGSNTVAIGWYAGNTNQGSHAIAIGYNAASNGQHPSSIVLNATGSSMLSSNIGALYVKPVRSNVGTYSLYYTTTSGEISYGTASGGGSVSDRFSTLFTSSFVASTITLGSGRIISATNALAIGNGAGASQQVSALAIGANCGSAQQAFAIAIGSSAGIGTQNQNAIAIGNSAGFSGQGEASIAIGRNTASGGQASNAIALGDSAGQNQSTGCIAIGFYAGNQNQLANSIAIGYEAGTTAQSIFSIAIGHQAGRQYQNYGSIAFGCNAGYTTQGLNSVAIGTSAASNVQGSECVAIGNLAGVSSQGGGAIGIGKSAGQNSQGTDAIAIGKAAGNTSQGSNSIAIGFNTAGTNQGIYCVAVGDSAGGNYQSNYSIAIGAYAGQTNQHTNSIVLNASGTALNTTITSAFFVKPVRNATSFGTQMNYDATSGEITYGTPSDSNLKENITTTSNYFDVLCQLRPIEYSFKEDISSIRHIGFIAQEVKPLLPSLVEEHNSTLYMNYNAFHPMYITAFQSLQSTNQGLQNQLSRQEQLLQALYSTLNLTL